MAAGPSSNLRLAGQLATVGMSFVFALVIGFGGGFLLDGWIGTKPWLSFLGFFLGLAAGVLNVYRILGMAGVSTESGPGVGSRESGDGSRETETRDRGGSRRGR